MGVIYVIILPKGEHMSIELPNDWKEHIYVRDWYIPVASNTDKAEAALVYVVRKKNTTYHQGYFHSAIASPSDEAKIMRECYNAMLEGVPRWADEMIMLCSPYDVHNKPSIFVQEGDEFESLFLPDLIPYNEYMKRYED